MKSQMKRNSGLYYDKEEQSGDSSTPISTQEKSQTELMLDRIDNKLDHLQSILSAVLNTNSECVSASSVSSETKLLTTLSLIDDKVTYLLDNVIL